MASIACGHCGGTHASVAEVRACAQGSDHAGPEARRQEPEARWQEPEARWQEPEARPNRRPEARPEPGLPSRGPSRASVSLDGLTPEDLAGPDALGRSVLIGPDDEVPGPWRAAPEVEADRDAGPDTIDRLHLAWRQRERLIIRWTGPLPDDDPVTGDPFHRLGPDHELPGERLRFSITANTVDLREGSARFEPLEWAAALRSAVASAGPGRSGSWPTPSTAAPSTSTCRPGSSIRSSPGSTSSAARSGPCPSGAHRQPTWRRTSWRRWPTAAGRPGSWPPPARARPGC